VDSLARYIELIVEPTFEDFKRKPRSVRHAFLACLVTYHAIDRATFPKKPGNLLETWRKESIEFRLVEVVALHFKHVQSDDARRPMRPDTIRITHPLGLDGNGEGLETRNLFFVVRDAIKFLHEQVKHSAPSARQSD
jgi:hypothetical protein